MTEWIAKWKENNWRTTNKKEVVNKVKEVVNKEKEVFLIR